MKSVIGILQPAHARARAEPREQRLEQRALRQRIARALQEEQRDLHPGQMLRAAIGGASGRVQRETEEGKSAHSRERLLRLCLGSHATAEGAAAGDERQRRHEACTLRDGRAHRGMTEDRRVGTTRTALHVGELVAQCGNAALGEPGCHRVHEGVVHARSSAVRQHIAGARGKRQLEAR
jgi:hypothetical protein